MSEKRYEWYEKIQVAKLALRGIKEKAQEQDLNEYAIEAELKRVLNVLDLVGNDMYSYCYGQHHTLISCEKCFFPWCECYIELAYWYGDILYSSSKEEIQCILKNIKKLKEEQKECIGAGDSIMTITHEVFREKIGHQKTMCELINAITNYVDYFLPHSKSMEELDYKCAEKTYEMLLKIFKIAFTTALKTIKGDNQDDDTID